MPMSPETITDLEAEKLLSRTSSPRDKLMFLLMLDAGLRVGELVQLLQSDLLIKGMPVDGLHVRAEIAKRKQPRTIPLTQRIKAQIELVNFRIWSLWHPDRSFYAFYVTNSVKHLSRRQVQRIIKRLSMSTLGRAIHPHVLRHTFASRLMRITNSRNVQELLGHQQLSSTQIYMHPNHQDLTEAIEKLNPG